MNDFIKAIGKNEHSQEIIAYFNNGSDATYTMNVFNLLKTDKDVIDIVDAQTGEVIFSRSYFQ